MLKEETRLQNLGKQERCVWWLVYGTPEKKKNTELVLLSQVHQTVVKQTGTSSDKQRIQVKGFYISRQYVLNCINYGY